MPRSTVSNSIVIFHKLSSLNDDFYACSYFKFLYHCNFICTHILNSNRQMFVTKVGGLGTCGQP